MELVGNGKEKLIGAALLKAPYSIFKPKTQTAPVVFASPHSGRHYPQTFIEASRLKGSAIRRSEDSFIDEIYQSAPTHGAPLLCAHFPRAYVDPNREPYELDASMFSSPLPDYVDSNTPRVAAGLGTIARVVTSGEEIYQGKLNFEEAQHRIEALYTPYHQALKKLIQQTKDTFGFCLLVDCHSMPSIGGPMDRDAGNQRVDFVLGDCHGNACFDIVTDSAEVFLKNLDYVVTRNTPYAGGFTTRHYGQPNEMVHALQIEVNRDLYMDEKTIERSPGLKKLQQTADKLMAHLCQMAATKLQKI